MQEPVTSSGSDRLSFFMALRLFPLQIYPRTWQLSQFPVTVKAVLPSWHAPQDFAFCIWDMVTGLPPLFSGKVPVWQALHLYMARWLVWLNFTFDALATLKLMSLTGWHF